MRSMNTKDIGRLKVADASSGKVTAVFATLGVIDKHGDVTRPGAFSAEDVLISAYGHESWFGAAPVGKGRISEQGDKAIFEGQFWLDTAGGEETFKVVKNAEDLQEWSYGFDVLESAQGEMDGQPVQFLDKLKVYEVSPVLVGAGIDTRTLAIKGDRGKMKFEQHIKSVVTDVGELIDRASSVVTLRAEQGKQVGEASAEALDEFAAAMKRLDELVQQLKSGNHDDDPEELATKLEREFERFSLDQSSQLLEA